jgi:hypothetical protein
MLLIRMDGNLLSLRKTLSFRCCHRDQAVSIRSESNAGRRISGTILRVP